MKLIKGLCFSLAALCLSQSAMAAADGHFTLRVGTRSAIYPGESLPIYFGNLDPYLGSGFYDVHCLISATDDIPVTGIISTPTNYTTVLLNGHKMYMDGDHLLYGLNNLDIIDVNARNGALYIYNNDWPFVGGTFGLYGECESYFHY